MGGAERRNPPVPGVEAEGAHRAHHRRFERLFLGHGWKDPGQARREHRLAGAGRSEHQEVVVARRGQLQRAPRRELAAHVAQVLDGGDAGLRRRIGRFRGAVADELGVHLSERTRREQPGSRRELRLVRVVARDHEDAARVACMQRGGERAAGASQRPVERQLADELVLAEPVLAELSGRREDSDRDREVVPASVLGQIGGREADGDAAPGEFEPGVDDGAAHAVLALAHGRLREADDRELRQPPGDMDLDPHRRRFDTHAGAAHDDRE